VTRRSQLLSFFFAKQREPRDVTTAYFVILPDHFVRII
jgi:hypothetical protein